MNLRLSDPSRKPRPQVKQHPQRQLLRNVFHLRIGRAFYLELRALQYLKSSDTVTPFEIN